MVMFGGFPTRPTCVLRHNPRPSWASARALALGQFRFSGHIEDIVTLIEAWETAREPE